ncbi:MBL fold metallo-hydrolase [Glycomyces sp. NRRL B-16210]|uniref:MBL fold metallo-hydrolase n=1 Tax=Glycomyces sp. NRRL B-16210 TaxID=1463821 RepID=UPI0004C1380D|nr:MBL fold metallo-hydrolase [Glycomyces sp. NRRL B-16210]
MRLTRFGHACVRLDTDQGSLAIDPGVYSDPAALDGVDAVFITHQHADHCNEAELRRLLNDRPGTRLYGPTAVAETLMDLPVSVVSEGDAVPEAGTEVKVLGRHHAVVLPDLPRVPNVGYLVDGVFHPGDAFTVPDFPIRLLLAPVAAPWSKIAEVVDYLRAVDAPAVIPIHDASLSDIGLATVDRRLEHLFRGAYRRLPDGQALTI